STLVLRPAGNGEEGDDKRGDADDANEEKQEGHFPEQREIQRDAYAQVGKVGVFLRESWRKERKSLACPFIIRLLTRLAGHNGHLRLCEGLCLLPSLLLAAL
ncbi:MAG: hypothetical protein ACK55Z_16095, partial [bacterium]